MHILTRSTAYSYAIFAIASYNALADATSVLQRPSLDSTWSNTLQMQSYLNHYPTDYGTDPLWGFGLRQRFQSSNIHERRWLLDIDARRYHDINTAVFSVGGTFERAYDSGLELNFSLSADYTRYDDLSFRQAVLSQGAKYGHAVVRLNQYLPLGNAQTYPSAEIISPSTLVGMYGVDLHTQQAVHLFDMTAEATFSHFWHPSVADSIQALSAGLAYQIADSLSTGVHYEYRNGVAQNDYGYRVSLQLDLARLTHSQQPRNRPSPSLPLRLIGSVIQAEAATDCTPGQMSFSAHGTTICSTTNPFYAAEIEPAAYKIKDGVDIDAVVKRSVVQDTSFTFNPKRLYVFDSVVSLNRFTIPSGTIILMSHRGGLVSRQGGSQVGDAEVSDTSDFVTISASAPFKKSVRASRARSRDAIDKLVKGLPEDDDNITQNADNDYTPRVGLVLAGQGQLNRRDTTLSTNAQADLPGLDLLNDLTVSTLATADDLASTKKATLRRSETISRPGLFGTTSLGGNTKDTTQLSSIKKTVTNSVPITIIADDVVVDQLSSRISNQYGIAFYGGQQWMRNSQFFATAQTKTGIASAFGSAASVVDVFVDMRDSTAVSNRAIRSFHEGVGSTTDATGATQFLLADSYIESSNSSGESAIGIQNGVDSGGQFASINNIFVVNGVVIDSNGNILDNSAGVFDLGALVNLERSNSSTAARNSEAMILMHNHIISQASPLNSAASNADIALSSARLIGLGNTFNAPSAINGTYGNGLAGTNGSNLPLGLGNQALPDLGGYMPALTALPTTAANALAKPISGSDSRLSGWFSDADIIRNIMTYSQHDDALITRKSGASAMKTSGLIQAIDSSLKASTAKDLYEMRLPDAASTLFLAARDTQQHDAVLGRSQQSQAQKMIFNQNPVGSKKEYEVFVHYLLQPLQSDYNMRQLKRFERSKATIQ